MSSNKIIPDDPTFMTDLFHKYFGLWYKTACAICHDKHLAEDIVLEAFTVLLPKVSILRSIDTPAAIAFVKTTIRFTARRYMAKHTAFWKRQETLEAFYESGSIPPPEEAVETKDRFHTLLSHLCERDRDLLFLHHYMGYTIKEISKLSGLKENTVAVYLHRAKEKLSGVLQKEGEGDA